MSNKKYDPKILEKSIASARDSLDHALELPETIMQNYLHRFIATHRKMRSLALPIAQKDFDYHLVGNLPLGWFYFGCEYFDKTGGCSMCDGYGKHKDIDHEQAVDKGLNFFKNYAQKEYEKGSPFVCINMGSATTLNNSTFPQETRVRMYKGINEILQPFLKYNRTAIFAFESRLPDLTKKKLEEVRKYIDPRIEVTLGVGLEASNPIVREVLVKKGYGKNATEILSKKIGLAKEYDIDLEPHAMLGIPGLTELEAIVSTIDTTKTILDAKANRAIIMTMNIKESLSLAGILHKEGHFSVPSIHSTIEVMKQLNQDGYNNFLSLGFTVSDPALEISKGCDDCTDKIKKVIKNYTNAIHAKEPERAAQEFADADINCKCKEEWIEERMQDSEKPKLLERLPKYVERVENLLSMEV